MKCSLLTLYRVKVIKTLFHKSTVTRFSKRNFISFPTRPDPTRKKSSINRGSLVSHFSPTEGKITQLSHLQKTPEFTHWHFLEQFMGIKFLLALLTLSAFFLSLHAAADPDPSRSLLQDPESEGTGADPPAEWESRKIGKHHHSSEAGGGVIIGGLVTVAFAAVYCYIRATRRKRSDNLT